MFQSSPDVKPGATGGADRPSARVTTQSFQSSPDVKPGATVVARASASFGQSFVFQSSPDVKPGANRHGERQQGRGQPVSILTRREAGCNSGSVGSNMGAPLYGFQSSPDVKPGATPA